MPDDLPLHRGPGAPRAPRPDPLGESPEAQRTDLQPPLATPTASDDQRLAALPPLAAELGRYRLLRPLGEGAMGEVFAAHDQQLDRDVALKLLRLRSGDDEKARTRLLREARALARLAHPNVVRVYDATEEQGRLFLAMELIDGRTLRSWMHEQRRSWREVLQVFLSAGKGLAAAHAAGIVHRDFKPDNVLIDKKGQVFVGDFGLARAEGPAAEGAWAPPLLAGEPTPQTDGVRGTPLYMAPEQLAGQPADARADLFSFCVALHEALYGLRPFLGRTVEELHHAIVKQELAPAPPETRVPAWLRRVVLRGLKARPEERWSSLAELLQALGKDRRRLYRLAALGALVLLATGVAFLSGSRVARVAVERPAQKLVAVLPLESREGAPELAWLSPGIGELVSAELHAAGGPRVVPADDVARMQRELSLPAAERPPLAQLAKVREALGADYVVAGSTALRTGGKVQLVLRLLDAQSGDEVASAEESSHPDALFDLASNAGQRLRAGIGIPALSARERGAAQALLPQTPAAARAYARALLRLRAGELVEARPFAEEAVKLEPGHAHAHLLLARILSRLGYRGDSRDQAKKAFELADKLEREDQLALELSVREISAEWERAIEVGRALVTFFPSRTDYALGLASVQAKARKGKECLETIEALRLRPGSDATAPSIDSAECACAESASNYERARASAEKAIASAEKRGARLLVATARKQLGGALSRLGRQDEALAVLAVAEKEAHDLGDRSLEATTLNYQASVFGDRRDPDHARPLLLRALELFRSVGNKQGEMAATNNLAVNAAARSDLATAKELYKKATEIAREVRDPFAVALHTLNAAVMDARADDVQVARRSLEEARALAKAAADPRDEATAQVNLCQLLQRAGDLAAAAAACTDAEKIFDATGERSKQTNLQVQRAGLFLLEGKLQEAEAAARSAQATAHTQGAATLEAWAAMTLVEVQVAGRSFKEAHASLEAAAALAGKGGDPETLEHVALERARLAFAEGKPGDLAGVAHELEEIAARAKAGGWIGDHRDARLLQGEALLALRDPRARELLAALESESQAAGDRSVVDGVHRALARRRGR